MPVPLPGGLGLLGQPLGHCPLLLPSFPVTEEPGASRKMWVGGGCCQKNSTTPQPVSSQGCLAVVQHPLVSMGMERDVFGKLWISYSCIEQLCLDKPRDFGEVRERRSWHTADLCQGGGCQHCHGGMWSGVLWHAALGEDALQL